MELTKVRVSPGYTLHYEDDEFTFDDGDIEVDEFTAERLNGRYLEIVDPKEERRGLGIDPKIQQILNANDIHSDDAIIAAGIDGLVAIKGIGKKTAKALLGLANSR